MATCKHCKAKFKPKFNSLKEPGCSDECNHEIKVIAALKAAEKYRKDREKNRKREWAIEKKERVDRLKTTSDWIQLLQPIFNRYIVLRDKADCCISCRTTKNVQYCASHYFNTKTFGNLRFHEDNVHRACNRYCNGEMSGNLIPYREHLINKIGIERFDALVELSNVPRHYTIPEIKEMIALYRSKIKELTK